MVTARTYAPALLGLCVLGVLLPGCDESLPPRNDPPAVLAVGLEAVSGTLVVRDSLPTGLEGAFRGSLTNVFIEVLQDSQRVRMVLDVYVKEHPEIRAHLVADRHYAEEAIYLNGELLTIPPRGTLHIYHTWSHRTDDGIWFWAFGPMTPGMTNAGEPYIESAPMTLVARGTVQGYKHAGAQPVGPVEATIRYRVF
jgi:hypothetical protein